MPRRRAEGRDNALHLGNGNMFSYLHPSGLVALRLAPAAREEFLAKYKPGFLKLMGEIAVGTIRSFLRQAGLSSDEWLALEHFDPSGH